MSSRQQSQLSRVHIQEANETCHTWEDFKKFLQRHKSPSHLADAIKTYEEIGYHPALFHTLYLL